MVWTQAHREELRELVDLVASTDFVCRLSPSPYETMAVLAAQRAESPWGLEWESFTRSALNEIAASQTPEGCWCSSDRVDSISDRIITTLAALNALATHRALTPSQLEAGRGYLRQHVPSSLSAIPESKKTIAFDALLVDLLIQLERRGYPIFPSEFIDKLAETRDDKLARKGKTLTDARGTIHSALDALHGAPHADWNKISHLQEPNGSMGIYASSTATLLAHISSDNAAFDRGLQYLENSRVGSHGFPPFYPSEEFERWWALLPLAQSPLASELRLPGALTSDIPISGIAVTQSFSLPDVDTSSMKAATLLSLNIPVSLEFLPRFFRDGVFICYEHELRTSPSANIHALMAITAAAKLPRSLPFASMVESALSYLASSMTADGRFEDKWHLSDLYTTSHAMELFVDILDTPALAITKPLREKLQSMLDLSREFVLDTQHDNGGFGSNGGGATVEETSYAVRALASVQRLRPDVSMWTRLERAAGFLSCRPVDDDPPLWLGKTLYRCPVITQGQRLSALALLDAISASERRHS